MDGWTSRKDFIQEGGITLNNIYYTFKNGLAWVHGGNALYNNFYGVQYDSSFNVLINEQPEVVKGFKTLNYTGTRTRLVEYESNGKWYSIAEVNANGIIPTATSQKQAGWYVNYVKTDLEGGEVKEFAKKEGKYFNYIKALTIFNDCEVNPDGIGEVTEEQSDPQDYILTVTIDEQCSSSGSLTPDTDFKGWYQWNAKGLNSSILEASTAQDAKCIIDNFYDYAGGGDYTQIYSTDYHQFKYVFSDGISVGTQMYNKDTLQPITEAGTYLWIKPPHVGQPSSPSLDPGNPATVPDSYYIVIIGSDGIIDSVTQYNTLNSCLEDPDRSIKMQSSISSTAKINGVPTSNPYAFSFPYPANTATNQDLVCGAYDAVEWYLDFPADDRMGRGGSFPTFYWYGPNDFEVGTQFYRKDPQTGEYFKADQAVAKWIAVYKTDYTNMGAGTMFSGFPLDPPNADPIYKIVNLDNNGIITSLTAYNDYTLGPC